MVNIAGSLLGEMAPALSLTETEQAQALAEESYRQQQIEEALNHLTQEAAAIDKAIAAAKHTAQLNEIARMEQQIEGLPGKMSQPAMEIAALQAKKVEIQILGVQLAEESKVPGAKQGLSQYNNNIGTLYGPAPEKQYSPLDEFQNISVLSAPQTVAQQEATRQSFNTMDEAIRSAETQPGFDNTMNSTAGSAAAPGLAPGNVGNFAAPGLAPSNVGNFAAPGLAEAQVTSNNLSAMSMVANQAAAEAFSSAIAAGATVAEATAAAEEAAQTAAQQAATQVGINPNSPTVNAVAMSAVNTQGVEVGRLAGMTPAGVAAAAQQAVTAAQQGKIGRNTLSEVGLLGPLGLAITAPEVAARRTREAQAIMERAMLNPAPVSPPTPEQNPLGPARNVPTPTQNPSPAVRNRAMTTSLFGPQNANVLNYPAPTTAPAPELNLMNPAYNTIDPLAEMSPPGLRGLTQTPGLTLGTMPADVPGFTSPSPVTSMPSALTGFSPLDAPQISAVTEVSPAASFFSAPEPVAPDATPVGPGMTVSGVQSSVPGISIAPTGMIGVSDLSPQQSAQVARAETLSSLSLAPDPPSANPSRGKTAAMAMTDVENTIAQQQAQQAKNAINAMMDVETQLGVQQAKTARANTLSTLSLAEPTPTTSRSSSIGRSSTSAPQSQATKSVASWNPENQVSFTEQETSDTDPDGKSIVCSAMNRSYGFGSFRNKLWIEQSKNLDPAYERGYHAIALPLIAFAYAGKSFPRRAVKTFLEHAARRRTADIWKQKRGRRDWIGAFERAIIEPICYLVGKMLGPKRGE